MTKEIAVCFFGITRSLTHTYPSIERNVLGAVQAVGTPKIYSHFFQQDQIDNPRTEEHGELNLEEYKLLNSDWLQLEAPEECLELWNFEALKTFGDYWEDDFRSVRNLVHQLHSLNVVTEAALKDGAEVCLFCRPDQEYHDSLLPALHKALRRGGDRAYLPRWQAWYGLNDRFAICTGRAAISAYGQRIKLALHYCQERTEHLHSERLLEYSLKRQNIPVTTIKARASRTRIDGSFADENFYHPIRSTAVWRNTTALAGKVGVRKMMKKVFERKPPTTPET